MPAFFARIKLQTSDVWIFSPPFFDLEKRLTRSRSGPGKGPPHRSFRYDWVRGCPAAYFVLPISETRETGMVVGIFTGAITPARPAAGVVGVVRNRSSW